MKTQTEIDYLAESEGHAPLTELAMAGAHLRGSASAHRTRAFGGAFVATINAIGASLHHIYAWLRRVHPKERTMSGDDQGDSGRHKLRSRIAIAFQKIARAVDARTAHRMTRSFYRSSRMPWTAGLN